MTYKDVIPKGFWHDSEPTPVARTVGELIEILKQLPEELELTAGFANSARITVYNIDKDGMHVEIEEHEEHEEDEDIWEDDGE